MNEEPENGVDPVPPPGLALGNDRIPVHHGDTLVGYAVFHTDGHLELHPPEEVANRVAWPESSPVSPERLAVSDTLETLFAATQVGQIEAHEAYLRAAEVVTAALNAEYERGRAELRELHPPRPSAGLPEAVVVPAQGVLAELDCTDVLGRLLVACVDKPEEVRAALTLRPCHITGMHDPDHHAKYTCSEQLTAVLQLLLAAMGVTHEDLPRGLHPGDEYWCHSVPVQEKYRERLRATYAWAGVEIPARLAAPGSD